MDSLYEKFKQYGFRPKKSLGQNFLFSESVLKTIAASVQGGICVEIGPGPGGLTYHLSQVCAKVVAIELDFELAAFLEDALSGADNVDIIKADFLKLDLDKLYCEKIGGPFSVAANLPYYITTPVIMKLLDSGLPIKRMSLMVQKEVADRILSPPGGREYGVLSVMCQSHAAIRKIADVPPGAFRPAPKVKSAVICFEPYEEKIIESGFDDFRRCVRAGFSSRRKQLLNNLSAAYGMSKEEMNMIIMKAGVDPAARAETLSVAGFDRLCMLLKHKETK